MLVFFVSCTKAHENGGHAAADKTVPKSDSAATMQKKAREGFVPYANRPPFGTPVETH